MNDVWTTEVQEIIEAWFFGRSLGIDDDIVTEAIEDLTDQIMTWVRIEETS